MNIQFADIQVNQMIGNTGIFIGNNQAGNWKSILKTNEGFGRMIGQSNCLLYHHHTVYDNDQIDFSLPHGGHTQRS